MEFRIRRKRLHSEFSERSFLQWVLIRGLAFGVMNWALLSAFFFIINPEWEFLTVSGISIFLLGLIFLAPIYGIFIYLLAKLFYFRLKKRDRLPQNINDTDQLTWKANIFCLPVIVILGGVGFSLFYDSYDTFKASFLETIEEAQRPQKKPQDAYDQ